MTTMKRFGGPFGFADDGRQRADRPAERAS
jgi:hypothetical protein